MKNKQALFLLLTANVVSGFAQGISMLAIPWYFASVLNSPSTFGIIYAITTLLSLFWSLYAGTLIDRYSRKNIFMIISLVAGLILLAVSLIGFQLGYVPIILITVVFTATVLNFNIHYPSLYAFGQEITEKENYGKINSYLEIQGQATTIISGALAAVLLQGISAHEVVNLLGIKINFPFAIKKWELHEIFLMDAITYFIGVMLIVFIRYTPQIKNNIEKGEVWKRVKTGYQFLRNNPLLFIFGNTSYAIFVVLIVEVHLLLPMYINNHLHAGADVYASSEIFYAIGALFAGVGIQWLFRKMNTVLSIIILMFATVCILYLVVFTKMIGIFFAFSFLMGITNAGARVLRITYLFHRIPNEVIGRAGSVFSMINIMLRFLFISLFSTALFTTSNNVIWAYFVCGTFVLFSMLVLIIKYKPLKDLK